MSERYFHIMGANMPCGLEHTPPEDAPGQDRGCHGHFMDLDGDHSGGLWVITLRDGQSGSVTKRLELSWTQLVTLRDYIDAAQRHRADRYTPNEV